MITKGMMTSNTPEWETPQWLFDELDKEFNFDLDVCADINNRKCDQFYNKAMDGLKQEWVGHRVWMNPPYGREIGKWVKKASENKNEFQGGILVALLPARTDTRWFHDYIYKNSKVEIRFIKRRLKFGGSKNSAPFPSMIVVFR